MGIEAIVREVREKREKAAEAWLNQLKSEIPYRDKKGEVMTSVLDVYGIVFENLLKERSKYRDSSDEYLKRNAIADCLAKFLDGVDPRLQGRHMSREEETADLFSRHIDMLEYAQTGLERGQKTAIEAGLSGIDLGNDFKGALNRLWQTVHPFVVKDEEDN